MHAERETRMQNRDDRIVFFYYPILSCLWKNDIRPESLFGWNHTTVSEKYL